MSYQILEIGAGKHQDGDVSQLNTQVLTSLHSGVTQWFDRRFTEAIKNTFRTIDAIIPLRSSRLSADF